MNVEFEVRCTIILEPKGKENPKLKEVKSLLILGKNIDPTFYFRKDQLPTLVGAKTIGNVLIQGLLSNIAYTHAEGMLDSAEHLRWIISELERGFVQVTEVKGGIY